MIVPITAYDTYGLREAALKAGCDEYITGPTEADELQSLLDRFLG